MARLSGSDASSEAEFQMAVEGPALALDDGLPPELGDGAYTLTFEQQMLSDAIFAGEPRDFSVSATCSMALTVPGGRSVFHIRVTFEEQRCSISAAREQLE